LSICHNSGQSLKKYSQIVKHAKNLESIIAMQSDNPVDYKRYVQESFRLDAIKPLVLLLERLLQKFPQDAMYCSLLVKSLWNSKVGRCQDAYELFPKALQLLEEQSELAERNRLIMGYLWSLSNRGLYSEVDAAVKQYSPDRNRNYYEFEAVHAFRLTMDISTYIEKMERIISLSEINEEKQTCAEKLLRFLDENAPEMYSAYFDKYYEII
jgi:hypothetical protein